MKVVALDPGITTGYAQGLIDGGRMGVVSGQERWVEFELLKWLTEIKPDIIIYERFEYRSKKAYNVDNAELFSRNLIGIIGLYEQQRTNDGLLVYRQMPATVLGKTAWWSDKELKEVGLYKPANPHAMDACRHLCYWFTFGAGFKHNTHKKNTEAIYTLV